MTSLRYGRATVTPGTLESPGPPDAQGRELRWDPPRRTRRPDGKVPRARRNGLPVRRYTRSGACEAADPRLCPFHGPRLAALDARART